MASKKESPRAAAFAERMRRGLTRAANGFYRYHYGVGVHTIRFMRRVGRRLRRLFAPLGRRISHVWRLVVLLPVLRFWRRLRRMGKSFPVAWRELAVAAKKNVFLVFPCLLNLARRAVRRYRDELATLWRFTGPVTAVLVLAITISVWNNADFCLTLNYQGQKLGYIDNAVTYDAAATLAKERVNNEDNTFEVEAVPTLSVTIRGDKEVLTGGQLCDEILRTAGDSIVDATGLYVDGRFIGAMESHNSLDYLLESIKDSYYDKTDKDQRAEFVQNVEMVDGLFTATTIVDSTAMKKKLTSEAVVKKTYTVVAGDTLSTIALKNDMTTSELRGMNPAYAKTDMVRIGDVLTVQRPQPFLRVKVIKTIRYKETIDYKIKTIYNDSKYVTYSKIKTKGQEGSQNVVAEITYMDGVESGRRVISTKVTKEPVTQVVERGTKKVVASGGNTVVQGDGVTTGNMLWPVPICHNMSRGYFRGHYAIDICNGPVTVRNKPAVAADGGTVVYAGWYYGYGNYVRIRHANGLETTYAHLNSISVVKGQQISRGQRVGLIGSTGNSTGPHLHFEVIRNGVKVNPLNYVRP